MIGFWKKGPNLKDEPEHQEGKGRTPYEEKINTTIEPQAPREGQPPSLKIGPAGQGGGEKKE